jgi:hypothetical protein
MAVRQLVATRAQRIPVELDQAQALGVRCRRQTVQTTMASAAEELPTGMAPRRF